MDAEPGIWWTLPGPRTFIARVMQDLENGRNCIVRLPGTLSTDSLRGAARKEFAQRESLVWEHRTAQELVQRSHEPAHALAEIYGIARPGGLRLTPHDVAMAGTFSAFVLWVDGWTDAEPDLRRAWFDFLHHYAHAAKQRDLFQRSVICLAVSGDAALEPSAGEDLLLADHWWWSAASRLDMAVLLEALGEDSGTGDELLEAMLVRAAGFDPGLAAWLVSSGCADGLAIGRALKAYADRCGLVLTCEEVALARSPAMTTAAPDGAVPASLAVAWSRGVVNHLRRQGVHWHLAALAGTGEGEPLHRELWGAQASVVLPRIDQQRVLVCRYLDSRYGKGWAGWHSGDDALSEREIVQIGHLKFLFDTDPRLRREPDELHRLVRWLHYARNELSHLRELPPQELERGQGAVQRAAAILSGPPAP